MKLYNKQNEVVLWITPVSDEEIMFSDNKPEDYRLKLLVFKPPETSTQHIVYLSREVALDLADAIDDLCAIEDLHQLTKRT